MVKKKEVYVDEPICIGCTLCTQICPNVFEMNDDGKSYAKNPEADTEENIQQAVDACPVSCIKWKEIK